MDQTLTFLEFTVQQKPQFHQRYCWAPHISLLLCVCMCVWVGLLSFCLLVGHRNCFCFVIVCLSFLHRFRHVQRWPIFFLYLRLCANVFILNHISRILCYIYFLLFFLSFLLRSFSFTTMLDIVVVCFMHELADCEAFFFLNLVFECEKCFWHWKSISYVNCIVMFPL